MIYEIAGLRVKIENKYDFTTKFCQEYLSEDQLSPVSIVAKITDEEFEEEKKASPGYSDGYIENICLYRSICRQMPTLGRILLHCSVLEYDGNAYAFLGRSGTGKSTHTKLWLKYLSPTRVINGDKPVLEHSEGNFIAYGTPWMGKERWGTRAKSPLKGLCFLEQAKVNAVKPLQSVKAYLPMYTTEAGMCISFRPVQPRKALSPIWVRDSGRVIAIREGQPEKAPAPIAVTPFSKMTEARD